MKCLIAALLLAPLAAAAQATGNCNNQSIKQCQDAQAISASGNSITIPSNGGLVPSFEEIISGAPSTITITIQGCGPGGTCDTLDTYTTVASAIRAPALSKAYTSYKVTATWTGGTNVNVQVNTVITQASSNSPVTPRSLCHLTTTVSNTGNTAANIVYQCVIPANTIGLNSRIDIRAMFTGSDPASTCTTAVKFGSLGTASDTNVTYDGSLANGVTTQLWASISERNATNAQVFGGYAIRGTVFAGQNPVGVGTATASTASTLYVTFTIQQLNATDTCSINEADVTLWL